MNEDNIYTVLSKLAKNNLSRKQLNNYCTDNEISILCRKQLIYYAKSPKNIKGVIHPSDDDIFCIGVLGKNMLNKQQSERKRYYTSLCIKIASLLIAAIGVYVAFVRP